MSRDQLLHLAQTLKLSPHLLQSMQILQMNTQELSDYLNDLALENPVMEYAEGAGEGPTWEEFSSRVSWLVDTPGPVALGDEDLAEVGVTAAQTDSLELFIRDQLSRLRLPPPLLTLCQYLADSLDHQGRLDPADLKGLRRAGVPAELLEEAVATLQSMDPPGIAARSLEECLVLQLQRLPGDHSLAIQLCGHLESLARERYKPLAAQLFASEADIKAAARQIQVLTPDPVGSFAPAAPAEFIHPDAWVAEVDGKLQVFVNQWDLPRFTLGNDYLQMAKTGQEEDAAEYLRQKIQQAQWVLQCVQRRQATLTTCLTALVTAQEAFFLGQAETPGPLLRQELAETLGVHPSTVTRTLRHKYIQCQQGLFPTAYFFSRRTGGNHSEQELKVQITQLIHDEDPYHPLSDQDIATLLDQAGISLARRTVAKYRQVLNIPPSHQRRLK